MRSSALDSKSLAGRWNRVASKRTHFGGGLFARPGRHEGCGRTDARFGGRVGGDIDCAICYEPKRCFVVEINLDCKTGKAEIGPAQVLLQGVQSSQRPIQRRRIDFCSVPNVQFIRQLAELIAHFLNRVWMIFFRQIELQGIQFLKLPSYPLNIVVHQVRKVCAGITGRRGEFGRRCECPTHTAAGPRKSSRFNYGLKGLSLDVRPCRIASRRKFKRNAIDLFHGKCEARPIL